MDQSGHELRGDVFEVNAVLTHGHIPRQINLMDPSKRSQKIARSRPHPLRRVDMDLSNAIAIIIACPFVVTMMDRDPLASNPIVAIPFIGIGHRVRLSEPGDVPFQGLAVGVFDHA